MPRRAIAGSGYRPASRGNHSSDWQFLARVRVRRPLTVDKLDDERAKAASHRGPIELRKRTRTRVSAHRPDLVAMIRAPAHGLSQRCDIARLDHQTQTTRAHSAAQLTFRRRDREYRGPGRQSTVEFARHETCRDFSVERHKMEIGGAQAVRQVMPRLVIQKSNGRQVLSAR